MLTLVEVTRSYGSLRALDGLSFSVRPGALVGFLGPNGAGKTTAMRAVMGLDRPDAGSISWNGASIGPAQLDRIGYLPEERGLYPKMRVGDQLEYFARLHGLSPAGARSSSAAWLERVELSGRAGDPTETLSLGNQQRVQLAVALVHRPDLLLLDEPFSGLDPIGSDLMRGLLLERAAAGATVIFSSHHLDVVQELCDEVVIIDHGRFLLGGPVEQLRAAGPRRLSIGTGAHWSPSIPGARLERYDAVRRRATVVLDDDVDAQALLLDAQRAGPVDHFSVELASLSQVFRAAVRSLAPAAGGAR